MGDARRRRLAGTKPTAGPVEAFRCPPGSVAISFDVEEADPSSAVFRAEDVADALMEAARLIPASVPYGRLVTGFATEFRRAKAAGCADHLPGLSLFGLWLTMSHPRAGEQMRRTVSATLRQDGRAHITLHIGADGLAIALAPAFVELTHATAAAAAAGSAVLVAGGPAAEPAPTLNRGDPSWP